MARSLLAPIDMTTRLLACVLLVACAPQAEPSSPSPSPSPPPELEVTQAQGLPPERVRALFAPAAESVQRCVRGRSGRIVLRVTSRDGALQVAVEPGIPIDAAARTCALDALSTVYLEESASNVGGPAVPPSGFTSLVTVSW